MGRFVVALLLSGLVALAPAQTSDRTKNCFKCKGEGTVPCPGKDHDQKRICGITIPHKCDALFRAACCRGTGKVVCPNCKDPIATADLEAEGQARVAWLESMKKLDDETGVIMVHVETDNFFAHWSIPSWKVKETTYSRIKAAHLFAGRLEEVATKFKEITGVLPATKQIIYFCNNQAENRQVTLRKMGVEQGQTFRQNAPQCVVCTWPDPRHEMTTDEGMHGHTVHFAAHTLIQAAITTPRELKAWFDEGIAHWLEIAICKDSHTFCWHEVGSGAKDAWQIANWYKKIYGDVSSNDMVMLATIANADVDRLRARDNAFCWSFIDWMVNTNREGFQKFFETFKKTNDTKKALDAGFNISFATLQEQWRAWVLKAYGGRQG